MLYDIADVLVQNAVAMLLSVICLALCAGGLMLCVLNTLAEITERRRARRWRCVQRCAASTQFIR